jgi:methionyl-tRNA formyltransferase
VPSPQLGAFFSDKTEEWTVKIYDAKILFEDHGLTTGMLICTKSENRSRKWLYQILSLQFPGKRR